MKLLYDAAGKKPIQDKINTDDAWSKFSKKLSQQTDEKPPVIKKLTLAFYSKAAIFICMLGIGYLLASHFSNKEKVIVFSSTASGISNSTLPDGSFVALNPKSSITYSSSFNTASRELKLTGEAFFQVQHNAELPFIVSTGNVFVKDIGTSFTIKAIPSDSTVTVHVEEGEVVFYSLKNSGIPLIQGETGIYNQVTETFRKKDIHTPAPSTEINQVLSFENTSLRFVIDTLNKVYNEHISLSCEKLEALELTATFKEKTAAPIIDVITETFSLTVVRSNGTVSLNSKDCK